jgi:hypothetical protein
MLLIVCRFLLGPLLFYDALDGQTGILFGVGLVIALLSDIFDGVIARHVGVATAKLRELDSWVDGWFCLWIAACAWFAHHNTVVTFAPLLMVWFVTDHLAHAFDWFKYHRFAAYHAYSAKIAGLLLFLAVFVLFTFGSHHYVLGIALLVAIVSHLERMAITAILSKWTPDVKSLWHAWKLQQKHR